MPRIRLSWVALAAVAIVTIASPGLRENAWLCRVSFFSPPLRDQLPADIREEGLACDYTVLAERALNTLHLSEPDMEFVQSHYPDDPRMLLAAASRSTRGPTPRSLARRAVEAGGGAPAHAAYVGELMAGGPNYFRLGNTGSDPDNPEQLDAAKKEMAESKLPDHLTPEAAAPLLDAIHAWERADPENGLPHAMEAFVLYGLHRDGEALSELERAGQLPKVTDYASERARAMGDLDHRRGVPDAEAVVMSDASVLCPLYATLRQCARLAAAEGYLAASENRPRDALRWWRATQQLGARTAESADSAISYLVGAAIQSIGTQPVWKWYADENTSLTGGPLQKGHLFYGRRYDFYAAHAGKAAVTQARDDLLKARAHTFLLTGGIIEGPVYKDYVRSVKMLTLAGLLAGSMIALLLLFLAAGAWGREEAEAAASRSPWTLSLSVLLIFAGGGVGAVLAFASPVHPLWAEFPFLCLVVSMVCSLGAVTMGVLIMSAFAGRSPSPLASRWRGNLRRAVPITLATGAIACLALSLASLHIRAAWVKMRRSAQGTDMAIFKRTLGNKWTNPTIPPDSWRDEYPPKK